MYVDNVLKTNTYINKNILPYTSKTHIYYTYILHLNNLCRKQI